MKKRHIFFLFVMPALTFTVFSQPPPPQDEMGIGRPPMEENEFRPASPVQRWMRKMRESNPEEFERLNNLRLRDPESFRAEARAALESEIMSRLAKQRPAISDAIAKLSNEDKKWLLERIARSEMPMEGGPMPFRERRENDRNDHQRNRELVRQYHQSRSAEEKEAIRQKLREELSQLYDQRINERGEQLQEAEQKLEAIRRALKQGEQGKGEFIDDKLDIWLNSTPRNTDIRNRRPPPPPGEEPPPPEDF
jgi:hypothetical protein